MTSQYAAAGVENIFPSSHTTSNKLCSNESGGRAGGPAGMKRRRMGKGERRREEEGEVVEEEEEEAGVEGGFLFSDDLRRKSWLEIGLRLE